MYSNTKAYYNNIHKAKPLFFIYWETHMRTWHGAHHCTHHSPQKNHRTNTMKTHHWHHPLDSQSLNPTHFQTNVINHSYHTTHNPSLIPQLSPLLYYHSHHLYL